MTVVAGAKNVATPSLSGTFDGTGSAVASVQITVAGHSYAAILGTSSWSLAAGTISPALADGSYELAVMATDAAGNTGTDTTANELLVDTLLPVVTVQSLVTADATPALAGTVDATGSALASIEISVGSHTLTPDVVAGGWSLADGAVPSDLPDGVHNVVVTAADAAGNSAIDATHNELIVDTTGPTAFAPADGGDRTRDGVVTFSWAAATDALSAVQTYYVSIEKTRAGSTTIVVDDVECAEGLSYLHTDADPQNGDTLRARVRAVDALGNEGAYSSLSDGIEVDATVPATPDKPTTDPAGPLTNQTTITFSWVLPAGAEKSEIRITSLAGTFVDELHELTAGPWEIDFAAGEDGQTLVVQVRGLTSAGVAGSWSAFSDPITIDTSAPGAPVISSPAAGSYLAVDPFAIAGTADAHSEVAVHVDGAVLVGTATADDAGAWSLTPAGAVGDGARSLTATASDAAGNTSPASAAVMVHVDTAAPLASVDALLTNDATPALAGGLDGTGSNVTSAQVTVNGQVYAAAVDNTAGRWSVADGVISVPLAEGVCDVAVAVTDAAGNTSSDTTSNELTIDLTGPVAAIPDDGGDRTGDGVIAFTWAAAADTYSAVQSYFITVVKTRAGTPVTLVDDLEVGASLGYVHTDADPQTGDLLTARVRAVDALGNQGAYSGDSDGILVDAAVPSTTAKPTVSPAGPVTSQTTILFAWSLATGADKSEIHIWSLAGPAVDETHEVTGAPWQYSFAGAQDGQTLVAQVRGLTSSGVAGPWSLTSDAVTVDTSAPSAPVITDPAGGAFVATDPFAISGTAEAHSTVELFVAGSTPLGTTAADDGGSWSFTPASALGEGAASLTARATDAALNTSAPSAAVAVTVDTLLPVVTVNSLTTVDSTPGLAGTLDGTGSPILSLQLTVGGHSYAGVIDNGAGTWSLADDSISPPLGDGVYDVVATVTDAAGNVGMDATTNELTVNTNIPSPPDITTPGDNSFSSAATFTIAGTAGANLLVELFDGGASLGTTTSDADGSFTLDLVVPLTEGSHTFTATAEDAGLTSAPSAPVTVTVDTVDPTVTVAALVARDNRPALSGTLSGTGSDVVSVSVVVDGHTYSATVDNSTGTWLLADGVITPALAEGTFNVTATATDAAGNTGSDTTTDELHVDTLPPTVTLSPLVTNDATPPLSGTVDGTGTDIVSVQVRVAGRSYAAIFGAGVWSLPDDTISPPLADQVWSVTVTAVDLAGSSAVDTTASELTVDTLPPVVLVDYLTTSDTTPAVAGSVNGTGSAVATVLVTVDGVDYTATVDNGAFRWSLADDTIMSPLGEGPVDVIATATDAAGNVGTDFSAAELQIDSAPPWATVDAVSTTGSYPDLSGSFGDPAPGSGLADGTLVVTVQGMGSFTQDSGQVWVNPDTSTWWLDGDWIGPLAEGAFDVAVSLADRAGNIGADSSTGELVVDRTGPAATVTFLTTADQTPELSGTIEDALSGVDLSTLEVSVMWAGTYSYAAGEVTVVGTTWSLPDNTVGVLGDGRFEVTVTASDNLGNWRADSTTLELLIDTEGPELGVDHLATADATPPLTGRIADWGVGADPGTLVVTLEGTPYGPNVAGEAWAIADNVVAALGDGYHTVQVAAEDLLGNGTGTEVFGALLVDTTGPVASAPDDGGVATGDGTVFFTWAQASDPWSAVQGYFITIERTRGIATDILVNDLDVGDVQSYFFDGAGVADGDVLRARVRAVDVLGNAGAYSALSDGITVDPAVPAPGSTPTTVPSGPVTNLTAIEFGFMPTTGADTYEIEILSTAGPFVYEIHEITAAPWWHTFASGQDGQTLVARVRGLTSTNVAGPWSSYSSPITIDTSAPFPPSILVREFTNADPVPFEGHADPGAEVAVYDDGTLVATCTALLDGSWSADVAGLAEGAHTNVTATATDAAGNTSDASAAVSFTIDRTAPSVDSFVRVSASPAMSSWVEVTCTASDDPGGSGIRGYRIVADDSTAPLPQEYWQSEPPIDFGLQGEGSHTLYAWVLDAAGNVGGGATVQVVWDATRPEITIVSQSTPVTSPQITGSFADAVSGIDSDAAEVWVSGNGPYRTNGGSGPLQVTSLGAGQWSWTLPAGTVPSLSYGDHWINVHVADLAGNWSSRDERALFIEAPPQVQHAEPWGGSVSPAQEIVLWFNVPMNRATVESAFSLVDASAAPITDFIFLWDTNSQYVRIIPDTTLPVGTLSNGDVLASGETYTATLTTAALSQGGAALENPWSVTFYTYGSMSSDHLLSAVAGTTELLSAPAPASDVEAGDAIVFRFDLDPSPYSSAHLRLESRTGSLEVGVNTQGIRSAWVDAGAGQIVFQLYDEAGLEVGDEITVVGMSPPEFNVTGAPIVGVDAPNELRVENTTGASGSAESDQGQLRRPWGDGELLWSAPYELTWVLGSSLTGGDWELTIENLWVEGGGSFSVWDQRVQVLHAVDDGYDPIVTGISPADGATGVALRAPILIGFSEPTNLATLSGITVSGGGLSLADFEMELDKDEVSMVHLTPKSQLPAGVAIAVSVPASVQDLSGRGVTPASATFTTVSTVDTDPPFIVESTPPHGETRVPAGTYLAFRFNEAVDVSTIEMNDFAVEDVSEPAPVLLRGWQPELEEDGIVLRLSGQGLSPRWNWIGLESATGAGNLATYQTMSSEPHGLSVGTHVRVNSTENYLFSFGDSYDQGALPVLAVPTPDSFVVMLPWSVDGQTSRWGQASWGTPRDYRVSVGNIADLAGNSMTSTTIEFTVVPDGWSSAPMLSDLDFELAAGSTRAVMTLTGWVEVRDPNSSDTITVTIRDTRVGHEGNTITLAAEGSSYGDSWYLRLGQDGGPPSNTFPSWLDAANGFAVSGEYEFEIVVSDNDVATNDFVVRRNVWIWAPDDVPDPETVDGQAVSATAPVIVDTAHPTFTWSDAGADETDLQVFFFVDFATIGNDGDMAGYLLPPTATSFTLPPDTLLESGVYAWFVARMHATESGRSSEAWSLDMARMLESMFLLGPDNDLLAGEVFGVAEIGMFIGMDEQEGGSTQPDWAYSYHGLLSLDPVSEAIATFDVEDQFGPGAILALSSAAALGDGTVEYTTAQPHNLGDHLRIAVTGMSDSAFDTPATAWPEISITGASMLVASWPGAPVAGSATGGSLAWRGPMGGVRQELYAYDVSAGGLAITRTLQGIPMPDRGTLGEAGDMLLQVPPSAGEGMSPPHLLIGSRRVAQSGFSQDALGTEASPGRWVFLLGETALDGTGALVRTTSTVGELEASGGGLFDFEVQGAAQVGATSEVEYVATGHGMVPGDFVTVTMDEVADETFSTQQALPVEAATANTFTLLLDSPPDAPTAVGGGHSRWFAAGTGALVTFAGEPTGFMVGYDVSADGRLDIDHWVGGFIGGAAGAEIIPLSANHSPLGPASDQAVLLAAREHPLPSTGGPLAVTAAAGIDNAGATMVRYSTAGAPPVMAGDLVEVSGMVDGAFDTPIGQRIVVQAVGASSFDLAAWLGAPSPGQATTPGAGAQARYFRPDNSVLVGAYRHGIYVVGIDQTEGGVSFAVAVTGTAVFDGSGGLELEFQAEGQLETVHATYVAGGGRVQLYLPFEDDFIVPFEVVAGPSLDTIFGHAVGVPGVWSLVIMTR